MHMKKIDNASTTKANATGGNRRSVHNTQMHSNKYIKHLLNKPTTTSMKDRQI